MLHKMEVEMDQKMWEVQMSLAVCSDDEMITAMAKTVGLPLAIAAKNVLAGKIQRTEWSYRLHPIYICPFCMNWNRILHQLHTQGKRDMKLQEVIVQHGSPEYDLVVGLRYNILQQAIRHAVHNRTTCSRKNHHLALFHGETGSLFDAAACNRKQKHADETGGCR